MKAIHLLLCSLVATLVAGCSDPVVSVPIIFISAQFSTERIEVRTADSVYRTDRVQARFLEDADFFRPFTVDSVLYNESPLPLVAADSGLYRLEAPVIASIVPGDQQRFRIVGNATFPSVVDSIKQPEHIDMISPVAASEISLLQDIPITWVPLNDAPGNVMLGISTGPTLDSRVLSFSTSDDGADLIPARMLANVASGSGYLIVSRENSVTHKAGERNYQVRGTSTVAIQVTFRR